MSADSGLTKYQDIPCCPDLDTAPICDVLDFRRHLVFPTSVRTQQGQIVLVEVIIHTRFTRCPGPLALGDIVYTTTLLPGEKGRYTLAIGMAAQDKNGFPVIPDIKLDYIPK